VCFYEVYGSLMDTCFNVFCINAIYKHIHYGEYTNMYIMFKHFCQKNQKKKKKKKKLKFFLLNTKKKKKILTPKQKKNYI